MTSSGEPAEVSSPLATGIGSLPGDDAEAYTEWTRVVWGEAADHFVLPWCVELPGRGATAAMTGRSLAVVEGLGADLQPAGWRLTDASGVDHRRARSLLAQDLDTVEEVAQEVGPDSGGSFKVQVAGPWTLAATVEKPRGDKVLCDHGARRELTEALAEGLGTHLADVRRRLPGVDRFVVQVDEPALAAVLAGRVPTASGFSKHRSVDLPEASAALRLVADAIIAAGAEPWAHLCAPRTPIDLVSGAGYQGLLADVSQLGAEDTDAVAELLEGGRSAGLGLLAGVDPQPTTSTAISAGWPGDNVVVDTVMRWLDVVGLDLPEVAGRLVLTPSCGQAGASKAWARHSLRALALAARALRVD